MDIFNDTSMLFCGEASTSLRPPNKSASGVPYRHGLISTGLIVRQVVIDSYHVIYIETSLYKVYMFSDGFVISWYDLVDLEGRARK